MNDVPRVTHGILLMEIAFENGVREILNNETFDVGKYLKHSYNRFESYVEPAVIFKFRVENLEIRAND